MHLTKPISGEWQKWLPPSPHREKVLDFLAHARATLIMRGPDQAPLLAFEDGGTMELDKARYDEEHRFYQADNPGRGPTVGYRATRFSDVCASVDEIKRLVTEEPERVGEHPEVIDDLLADCLYMIARMGRRHSAYVRAAEGLQALARRMAQTALAEQAAAETAAAGVEELLVSGPGCPADCLPSVCQLVEQIRSVAQEQEDRLRDEKQIVVQIGAIYRRLRGPRDWSAEETEADKASG